MEFIDALESQLLRVLFYPETSLQWFLMGGGGFLLLLAFGKLFTGMFDIKKGFLAIFIGVVLALLAGLSGLALADLYFLAFTENRWVGRLITALSISLVVFLVCWISSTFVLKNSWGNSFFFSLLVLGCTYGTLYFVDRSLSTGESAGSQVDYWKERQGERMGDGLQ